MARTFAHEESYRSKGLVSKLGTKLITVCGGGALGSNLIEVLSRQGATKLRVIDFDRVEIHNINTQIFGMSDVGAMKVAAIKKRIFNDTHVEVETFDKKMAENNVKKFLKDSDLVIDAFDNMESRGLVQESCRSLKIPCLHLGMFEGYGEIVWDHHGYKVPENPDKNAVDVCDYPLSRNIVQFVVAIGAEETVRFIGAETQKSWSITLKDLSIRPYR